MVEYDGGDEKNRGTLAGAPIQFARRYCGLAIAVLADVELVFDNAGRDKNH